MYKIIIYNNNLEVVKKTCNILSSKFDNIEMLEIVTSQDEFIIACERNNFNIIFISDSDIKSEEIQSQLKHIDVKIIFCKHINKNKGSKYTLYLPIDVSEQYFYTKLQSFLSKSNERKFSQKIHKVLQNYNFDFKLKGTNFLAEAILYSYLHKEEYLFENLEQNIYPHVAKYFNVDQDTVKWAIIRSVNNMNIKLSSSPSKDYYANFGEKITPKLLISDIVHSL